MKVNQKKYLLVSAGVHGILLLGLLILPASSFTPEKPQSPALKIRLQSSSSIEAVLRQQTLQTTPTPPAPEPVLIDPEPVKVKPPKPAPKPQPVPKPKKSPKKPPQTRPKKPEIKNKPDFNKFQKIERMPTTQISEKAQKQQRERASQAAHDRQEVIRDRLGALSEQNLSDRSEVAELGADNALENWRRFVGKFYDDRWRWRKQTKVSNSRSTVEAKVVINLDGSVASAQIVQPSGVAELDDSVQDVLDRVRKISKKPPSKTSIKDRTFTIAFNLKDGRINTE